ncbi:MAG: HD domain-containing phosphohydrolase [Sulfurovum sp.]|uniref:HD domain-containing phosphohydrolase n=1 Tax=Sulfurovum sp. TaxID=1969726 RepID=UPI003C7078A5
MPRLSIKTHIFTIFLLLVGVVSFSLLFSQYYFSEKLAIDSTHKTFRIISKNISEHIHKEAVATRKIINLKSNHKNLLEPITFNPLHPFFDHMVQVLERSSNLHAIYFVHPDGRFYEVIHMQDRPRLFKTFHEPESTHWTIVTIIDNQQQNAFLDKDFELISQTRFDKKYDLHSRPWYVKALNSTNIITTLPYLFSNSHQMGVTYAKQIETKGIVLALDYTMSQLNEILALQRFDQKSEVFLVDNDAKKFASSAFPDSDTSLQTQLLDTELAQALKERGTEEIIKYSEGENNYFVMFAPLISKDKFLGIKIDADALLKPYKENIQYALLIAFILLLLAIPFIFFSTNLIVKPIRALILENTKIKEREYADVNAIDTNIIEFEALSNSQVSMSKSIQAYEISQEELLDAIIKVMAEAIDTKSPYTGKHCARVPEIAKDLLDEANRSTLDAFKTFSLRSKDELREFQIGAWLHDCGKVTTPEYVVDKATKLETIYNRIHEIRMRFEVLWRDAQIEYLQDKISLEVLEERQIRLREDFAFIASANVGSEFMEESQQARIKDIAQMEWQRYFDDTLGLGPIETLRYTDKKNEVLPVTENLLSDKTHHIVPREDFDYDAYASEGFKLEVPEYLYNYGEIYNLCIDKGTLSPEERYKINEHVIMSIKMLEKIPFPSHLTKIPEYAGTHHETLIGTGYPKKLTKDELSIPARIMAIADIFEALTASDRPYKKAKTLSESIKIMSFMVKDKHIDEDLFKLFLTSGIYKNYAEKHLKPEQIDEINIESYL